MRQVDTCSLQLWKVSLEKVAWKQKKARPTEAGANNNTHRWSAVNFADWMVKKKLLEDCQAETVDFTDFILQINSNAMKTRIVNQIHNNWHNRT